MTIDENAILANFRYKPKGDPTKHDRLQHDYLQSPVLYHILQSIISGSIRAPDRLKAAKILQDE